VLKKQKIKNPNHSRAVGILKPQIGIIDITAELRGLRPNLSNQDFVLVRSSRAHVVHHKVESCHTQLYGTTL